MSASDSEVSAKRTGDRSSESREDWGTLVELVGDAGSLDDASIQVLMFMLKEGLGQSMRYSFKMRLSGAFSGDLIEDVQRLAGHRILVRQEGKYLLGDAPEVRSFQESLSGIRREAINQVVHLIEAVGPKRLSMLPTVLLAFRESSESDEGRLQEQVVDLVSSLRPGLDREDVVGVVSSFPRILSGQHR